MINVNATLMSVLTGNKPECLAIASPEGRLETCGTNEIGFQSYWEVADLMQKGRSQQARELALTIPMDHLRSLALLLVNNSRRL
jgi:hypothetical protein